MIKRPRRWWKILWHTVRFLILGGDPPTLRSTIYRVVLVAVLVPCLFFAWSSHVNSRDSNVDVRSLETFVIKPNQDQAAIPDKDREAMRRIILMDSKADGGSPHQWPLDNQSWEDLIDEYGLPSNLRSLVNEKGWAYGDCVLGDKKARFAIWLTPEMTSQQSIQPASLHLVVKVPAAWYSNLLSRGVGLLFLLGILSIIASPAAWFLDRRIGKPVLRLARASEVMARGENPGHVPPTGAKELVVLTRSFNYMASELSRTKAAERDFLLSVSHELRTPLTAIEGYAELLADEAVSGQEAAPVLSAEAMRLRRLVNDLLDLAKLNQSTFSIKHEPVSLPEIVKEVVQRHAARARELGVEIADHAVDTAEILGDEDRLIQAVSNLVENALRVAPRGTAIRLEATGTTVSVTNKGPGLSENDLPRAFERFYLHNRLKGPNNVGNGLGLAIVKELVEKMGGRTSVQSDSAGTRFTLTFPAVSAAEMAVASGGTLLNASHPMNVERRSLAIQPTDEPRERDSWVYLAAASGLYVFGLLWALESSWIFALALCIASCAVVRRCRDWKLTVTFVILSVVLVAFLVIAPRLAGS